MLTCVHLSPTPFSITYCHGDMKLPDNKIITMYNELYKNNLEQVAKQSERNEHTVVPPSLKFFFMQ